MEGGHCGNPGLDLRKENCAITRAPGMPEDFFFEDVSGFWKLKYPSFFFCTNTLKNTEINPMAEMHPGILLEVFPKTQPINVPQMTRRSPIQI